MKNKNNNLLLKEHVATTSKEITKKVNAISEVCFCVDLTDLINPIDPEDCH